MILFNRKIDTFSMISDLSWSSSKQFVCQNSNFLIIKLTKNIKRMTFFQFEPKFYNSEHVIMVYGYFQDLVMLGLFDVKVSVFDSHDEEFSIFGGSIIRFVLVLECIRHWLLWCLRNFIRIRSKCTLQICAYWLHELFLEQIRNSHHLVETNISC